MSSTHDYHLLRPDQIDAERSRSPIAYVPWGAIEWHSYHNPIGLDGLIAHGLCRAVAESLGGLVFPPMYLATDTIKEFKGFAHSIEHRAETVRTVCTELIRQLVAERFSTIVLLTGHAGGGHTEALTAVVEQANKEIGGQAVLLYTAFSPIQDQYPGNHAADGETSLLMHFHPELVDLSRLPADRPATLDDDGVWGSDPRNASAEKGSRIVDAFVAAVSPEITSVANKRTQP